MMLCDGAKHPGHTSCDLTTIEIFLFFVFMRRHIVVLKKDHDRIFH